MGKKSSRKGPGLPAAEPARKRASQSVGKGVKPIVWLLLAAILAVGGFALWSADSSTPSGSASAAAVTSAVLVYGPTASTVAVMVKVTLLPALIPPMSHRPVKAL